MHDALADVRQDGGGDADIARRDVGGAAIVFAAQRVEHAPAHDQGHAAEAPAFARADMRGGEPAGGGGEVELFGGVGHGIINAAFIVNTSFRFDGGAGLGAGAEAAQR